MAISKVEETPAAITRLPRFARNDISSLNRVRVGFGNCFQTDGIRRDSCLFGAVTPAQNVRRKPPATPQM